MSSTNLQAPSLDQIQQVLLTGNLAALKPEQKLAYYNQVCSALGLNPLTKPFDYMVLQGREVLYANKGCTEQLRQVHKISLKITSREKIDDVYVVTAEASNAAGRTDSSTGAVSLSNLRGEALANAMMKAETKAKRRVTLSICGLNMLDETEVETITPKPLQVTADQPGPEDGVEPSEYRIPFGQWKNQSLEQVYREHGATGKGSLGDYCAWLEDSAAKKGTALGPDRLDFIERATDYIGSIENAPIESQEEQPPVDLYGPGPIL